MRSKGVLYFRISGLLLLLVMAGSLPLAADPAKIRVGVLAFGTVNWELDTVLHHGLDRAEDVELVVTRLSGKNAAAIALQGGAVDAIVTDWIWVSRQRNAGADFTFVPHSVAVGGLMVRPEAGIQSLADLFGKEIGVAGGPVDKSWLMLRALSKKQTGSDLKTMASPSFGAPPLLNKLILQGRIPAVLNFWHYTARLKAEGLIELVSVERMLADLGVRGQPPLIGWVFSEKWAASNLKTVKGFLHSLRAAKRILASSDLEWERLRPLMKADDDATYRALRQAYRDGIPDRFGETEVDAAQQLFSILAQYGGKDLVGDIDRLAGGTFWSEFRY